MQFTKIIVQDDLNAYKVFETLNARGVQLSTPDLLKNYIFSIISNENDISDDDLTKLDEQWSEIIEKLGEGNFTDFIRYHYNTKWKMVTKNELFLALRNVIGGRTEANDYLKSLFKYSSIYVSLINPEDSWWNDQGKEYIEAKPSINGIRLFNIKQPLTILLAAFDKFSPNEFVTISSYMYILSIRYNVICHLSPSEQESAYNVIATKISNGEFTRASHIKNSAEFRRLYPDDNMFKDAFEFHKMPSKQTAKKIRFILAEIENHNGGSCDYTKTTLEHICPYNPEQGWDEAFGDGINDIKDRLGNMVLISKDNLGRASFKEKKDEYAKSGFFLAKQVSSYHVWNLEKVNEHQRWMAEEAAKVWRVDFN
ncbi:HNH endonuclease family protein [Photorhabdus temperata]|uniref:GmrSD restriction endonucleases C-terminal domain-containing protein n=1 Tax=Photorhabdus temperata J3 TaxID=1389415 RepID=U7R372_PHOTE|nr:HNH endonuclease family protein [Photorhabdus temperata]ERT14130.1 hypothetical protein O185_05185 [Photorhabdus temperata J3]